MARNVAHFTPRSCSNSKTPSEYFTIRAPDNRPCCKCCGKKCCNLRYGKFDVIAELGQKRIQKCASQSQKCLATKRKEQEHKKTPKKAKCRSSCISPNTSGVRTAPTPTTMMLCPERAAGSTKRGSRSGWMICSHQSQPSSPQAEAMDTNDAIEMTNGHKLINSGAGAGKRREYCFANNPELQYKALLKRAHVLRMKEKQLQLKEKEIQKKNKTLRKRRRKFLKQGNAREKAELRATKMMEFARDKLIAFENQKCLQACGDTITAKRGKYKDKSSLKSRLMPSILMPCLCKATGKGDQSTCRGSCVKRLLGLSNPRRVRKTAGPSFSFSRMVKDDEMMKGRKVRSWTTARDACQPIVRSPPLPWVQPLSYRRRCDPKSHWKRLGYLLLCVAGVIYWVPAVIFFHCLSCCCHSE